MSNIYGLIKNVNFLFLIYIIYMHSCRIICIFFYRKDFSNCIRDGIHNGKFECIVSRVDCPT